MLPRGAQGVPETLFSNARSCLKSVCSRRAVLGFSTPCPAATYFSPGFGNFSEPYALLHFEIGFRKFLVLWRKVKSCFATFAIWGACVAVGVDDVATDGPRCMSYYPR